MSTGAAASPPPPSARGRRLTDPGPGPGARRQGWMWCRSPRILLDRKLEIPDSRTLWRSLSGAPSQAVRVFPLFAGLYLT